MADTDLLNRSRSGTATGFTETPTSSGSTELIPANRQREGFYISNDTDVAVSVSFDGALAFKLVPGAIYESGVIVFTGAINIRSATDPTSGNVTGLELEG